MLFANLVMRSAQSHGHEFESLSSLDKDDVN